MTRRNPRIFGDTQSRSRRLLRKAAAGSAAAALALGAAALPASAEDDLTVIPDEVVRSAPGSVVTVAQEQIPADLVGKACDVRIATANGSSVHPGNVVITITGDQRYETEGVEDSAEGQVSNITSVELGETLTLQLRMGPDGESSLGFTVAVDCPEPPAEPDPVSTPTVLPAQQQAPPVVVQAPPAVPVAATPTFTG